VSTNPEAGSRSQGSFAQRAAVIVGGGGGLGRAVSKALARQANTEAGMLEGRWKHPDTVPVSR
jgi:hypothetical protein